jgi:citrate lyase subunit beta / citryl-CoA lyase
MSKVAEPPQVAALEKEVEELERRFDIPAGSTELAPKIDSARGLMQTYATAKASQRVTAVVGSTEAMAADLGAYASGSL